MRDAMIIRSLVGKFSDRERWQVYFDCLARAEAAGRPASDGERRELWAMCQAGRVEWRADPYLLAAA